MNTGYEQNRSRAIEHSMAMVQNQQAMVAPPSPPQDGVRSLAEQAHTQLEILQSEIARLGDLLDPVRLPVQSACGGAVGESSTSEPQCVIGLRILVERIVRQQQIVRQIADELRI